MGRSNELESWGGDINPMDIRDNMCTPYNKLASLVNSICNLSKSQRM